ncbi:MULTISPECIES: hypothetical protein [Microbacterium]|uniref:hypothetical protein n=1 Tax=Microbacterium TaxID=33882 RepID=UPI000D64C6CF|nr:MULTISPECIES: hypothetical protein [Microbacterium]
MRVERAVVYAPITPARLEEALADAGLDAGTIGFVAAMEDGIARGVLSDADLTLARLIGRPTTPIADALRAGVDAAPVTV